MDVNVQKHFKNRDSHHQFKWTWEYQNEKECLEKCVKCGKVKSKAPHNLFYPKGSCYKQCRTCGMKEVLPHHSFETVEGKCLERCTVCGATESIPHSWRGRKNADGACEQYCAVCGEIKPGHDWNWCTCRICKKTDNSRHHDWKNVTEGNFTDIMICRVCKKRDESQKITLKQAEMRRQLEEMDSLHDMRAAGFKC